MGVKLAVAMGADVTVLSTSPSKEDDAKKLGAHKFVNIRDDAARAAATGSFDFILDTISANHDYNTYLSLLCLNGVMVIVGVPTEPAPLKRPDGHLFTRQEVAAMTVAEYDANRVAIRHQAAQGVIR